MALTPMTLGALVADAAAMGLHWIYDQDHIRTLAPDTPEFRTPAAADYDGVTGYFAHPTRRAGDQSQYGEQALVMHRALEARDGAYDAATYAEAFRSHFGYGGAYVGYIDRATRETLNNAAQVAEPTPEMGSQDDQLPAIAKLPPLVAALEGADDAVFDAAVRSAIAVTNNNQTAQDWGRVAAHMMRAALDTADRSSGPRAVLAAARRGATPEALALLDAACAMEDQPSEAVAEQFGMACYLSSGIPVVAHILLTSDTFTDAIRSNIYAGGDTCGRAILLGALMGALHGEGGETGIPEDWIARLTQV